jgi:hypothetical protein
MALETPKHPLPLRGVPVGYEAGFRYDSLTTTLISEGFEDTYMKRHGRATRAANWVDELQADTALFDALSKTSIALPLTLC